MFTYCPDCSSIYEISAEQLGAASGLVRCGNCDATFSALRRLTETPPDVTTETDTSINAGNKQITTADTTADATGADSNSGQAMDKAATSAATTDDSGGVKTEPSEDTTGDGFESGELPLPVEPLEDWDT
ncbi:MAG: hypothetical protein HKN70_14445, partial [Gammaproteobacteria bacterium]|nr:hypothetical protein [Gammaproteobacteria bacterium]